MEKRIKMNYEIINKEDMIIISINESYRNIAYLFMDYPDKVFIVLDENKKLYGYLEFNSFYNGLVTGNSCIITNFEKLVIDDSWKEDASEYFKQENNCFLPVVDTEDQVLFYLIKNQNKQTAYEEKWLNKKYFYLTEVLLRNNYQNVAIVDTNRFSRKVYEYLLGYCERFIKISLLKGSEINNCTYDIIFDVDEILYSKRKKLGWILFNQKLNKYKSIKGIFQELELYQLVSNCLKNKLSLYFVEAQDKTNVFNITKEESFRIKQNKHWSYFMNKPEYQEAVKELFDTYYCKEIVESCLYLPEQTVKNNICYMNETRGEYCNVINGNRVTMNIPENYINSIYIAGPCIVFGPLVNDDNTISSYLQLEENRNGGGVRVLNLGVRGLSFYESLKRLNQIEYKEGDQIILFLVAQKNDTKVVNKLLPEVPIYQLCKIFNSIDRTQLGTYFLDNPIHCNHKANQLIADYVYHILKETCSLEKFQIPFIVNIEQRNNVLYEYNKDLEEYLQMIKQYDIAKSDSISGAIVMNCNPFTLGHKYLIQYAASKVDNLFLFVVEENKSYFKFQDRLEMVKQGVEDIKNVVVLPSGKFIISSLTFPEYFTKEDSKQFTVDTSIDIEVFAQRIAPILHISYRFVGEEPFDFITKQYNEEMKRILPRYKIKLIEIPRLKLQNITVSASEVRKALKDENWDMVKMCVPVTTFEYLLKLKG